MLMVRIPLLHTTFHIQAVIVIVMVEITTFDIVYNSLCG